MKNAFTIYEALILIFVTAVVAGIAVPLGVSIWDAKRYNSTTKELSEIKEAILRYFQDTNYLPSSLDKLLSDTTSGWRGPYLSKTSKDLNRDGWNEYYIYLTDTAAGLRALVLSKGKNKTDESSSTFSPNPENFANQGDDISAVVSPEEEEKGREAITLRRLEIIKNALEKYFDQQCASTGNTTSNLFPTALADLRLSSEVLQDAWGNTFSYIQDCDTGVGCDATDGSGYAFESEVTTYIRGETFRIVSVGLCGGARTYTSPTSTVVTLRNSGTGTICGYLPPSYSGTGLYQLAFTAGTNQVTSASQDYFDTNNCNNYHPAFVITTTTTTCGDSLTSLDIANIKDILCVKKDLFLEY